MAGTLNIWDRLEFSGPDGSIAIGNLSRPKTITLGSGLHWGKSYTLATTATTKIYDIAEALTLPLMIRIEWTDGPLELSWGDDSGDASNADTSSFVTNDSVGGVMYLWGNGMYEHAGLSAEKRNGVDGGAATDVGIQNVYASNTSGGSITVRVDAFK